MQYIHKIFVAKGIPKFGTILFIMNL